MDISHLKQKFIEEAESLLTSLDNVLIDLEKSNDIQYVNEVFRVIHTIKGASGMFGFDKIVEITHEIESLYDLVRTDKLQLSPLLLEVTFSSADHIRALLTDENLSDDNNSKRHALLKENIEQIKGAGNVTDASKPEPVISSDLTGLCTWNIIFNPNDELVRRCVNMVYTFQDLFSLGTYKISRVPFESDGEQFWSIFLVTSQPREEIESSLMFVLDFCQITKVANFDIFSPNSLEKRDYGIKSTSIQSAAEIAQEEPVKSRKTSEITKELLQTAGEIKEIPVTVSPKTLTTSINVDAPKLDQLMYLVSELVTTKSELLLALQKQNESKAMDAAEKIEKLSKLFSENALSIRLVSLHEMLSKFKRLIRDLSKQLEKNVGFTIIGEDTELDKSIIDAIGEPIMHLIRNNIDHGIETPQKRVERGKPEIGLIRFEAYKAGNYVYISIGDDGNGIDTEYVYNKAVEKGFIQPNAQLTKKEIIDLIFLPGFSTAQSLSSVSGRGVGMDIVQKKIREIRGEIEVTSEKGVGTTFTIKLQQSVSIIDTLLVVAGNITYAIPVEDIESSLLEASENIANRQNNLIVFDNSLIPYINLREKFHPDVESITRETEKLIIINRQNKRYAVIADQIIGEYQAVIKPLGKAFSSVNFLSGASLLGDGSIALLIDSDKLWFETANEQQNNN
jgi:two-component system chemotaxis sensor kinase CheA